MKPQITPKTTISRKQESSLEYQTKRVKITVNQIHGSIAQSKIKQITCNIKHNA